MNEVFDVLDETFEHHHGIFLDKGTSSWRRCGIDHQRLGAVGGRCASLAAQVAHVTFYLGVGALSSRGMSKADWEEVWRTVGSVTPEEWDALRANLEVTYRRLVAELRAAETWDAEPQLASALAITVHTAYHLGEIRKALCTIE